MEMKRRIDYTSITVIEIKIDDEKQRTKILRKIFMINHIIDKIYKKELPYTDSIIIGENSSGNYQDMEIKANALQYAWVVL